MLDTDCAGNDGKALCNLASGQCVNCLTDSNCAGSTPVCVANECSPCTLDSQCASIDPLKPVCAKALGKCVECLNIYDCHDFTPICTQFTCQKCAKNADCAESAGFPKGKNVCDPNSGACVNCSTNSDCAGATPICVGNQCSPCRNDDDCTKQAGKFCSTFGINQGKCVECTLNGGCSGVRPVCNITNNVCGPCTVKFCKFNFPDMPCCNPSGDCSGYDPTTTTPTTTTTGRDSSSISCTMKNGTWYGSDSDILKTFSLTKSVLQPKNKRPITSFQFCCAQCSNYFEDDITCESFSIREDIAKCYLYASDSLPEQSNTNAWSGMPA